jgi:hypothetical protein
LALEARFFSKFVKRVTGHLRKKAVILIGVNQLRDKPMARYGPDYTEPGGNALKFFSSARNMMRGIVPPPGWERDSDNQGLCVEESVYGNGYDFYAFKSVKNIKNKHGIPYRKTLTRVWVEDSNGKARGFDPVFDAWTFYSALGLIEGSRSKKFKIKMKETKGGTYTWDSFKRIILAEADKNEGLLEEAVKSGAPSVKLLKHGKKLIASGEAEEIYIDARHRGVSGEVEDLEE